MDKEKKEDHPFPNEELHLMAGEDVKRRNP